MAADKSSHNQVTLSEEKIHTTEVHDEKNNFNNEANSNHPVLSRDEEGGNLETAEEVINGETSSTGKNVHTLPPKERKIFGIKVSNFQKYSLLQICLKSCI